MAAVLDKNHLQATVSVLQERVAASALKEKRLETENALLRRRLDHLEGQKQHTAADSGSCKLDKHMATLNTTLLEMVVSQQKYAQNALGAAVVA
jgi:hypothetical protein